MTHGEKAGHVRRDSFRRTEDQRLAFPAEPQLFVQIFTVEAVEQVFQRFLGVGVEDKRDLRGFVSLLTHFGVDVADLFDHRQVDRLVGYVEHDHVHACVGQHLSMLADDPFVVGDVITQVGFAPMMHRVFRAILRIMRVRIDDFLVVVRTQRVGCGGNHHCIVGVRCRSVVSVHAVPDDEKHADDLVFAGFAVLIRRTDFTAQRILRRPGIRFGLRRGFRPDCRQQSGQQKRRDSGFFHDYRVLSGCCSKIYRYLNRPLGAASPSERHCWMSP